MRRHTIKLKKRKLPPARQAVVDQTMQAIKEVKKQGTPSLERIKTVLRDKGKNMKIGHFYFCDGCEQPIYSPKDGVIVHGNIYVADPTARGGLIGNNFPDVKPGDKIEVTDVKETVLCRSCFSQAVFSAGEPNFVRRSNAGDESLSDEDFIAAMQRADNNVPF